jgi:hypothetical protein
MSQVLCAVTHFVRLGGTEIAVASIGFRNTDLEDSYSITG